ncbi:hypothetical protein K9K85_02730 [Patescibacteria group bacterium]|nr:hypothetical protein [Patescibacteria group bacterium]
MEKKTKLFFLLSDPDASNVWKLNSKLKEKGIFFKHGKYANMHAWIFSSQADLELAREIIKEFFPAAQES